MRTFGSGQTNGLPLAITALTLAAAQTLHTFPVGSATPHRVRIRALNADSVLRTLHLALYDSGATLLRDFDVVVPAGADVFDVLKGEDLVLNGTAVLKAYSDAVGIALMVEVDDQGDVAGIPSQCLFSGLVAAVQNASRFACPAPGAGVGTATRANAEIVMPRAGTLRNLFASMDATIGGGATVTVAVFVNGVASALSLPFTAADTNVGKTDTDAVAVAKGDKVTFSIACDNAGAPAANAMASVELF